MPDIDIVFINSGKTILGEDKFANWVEYKSTAHYYAGKDNDQAAQNTAYANDILNTWRSKIQEGSFLFYSKSRLMGETMATQDVLME